MWAKRRLSTARLRERDKARGEQAPRSVRCTHTHTHVHAHTHAHVCKHAHTCMYSGGYVRSQHRDLPAQLTPASTWPLPAQPQPGLPRLPPRTPADPLLSARCENNVPGPCHAAPETTRLVSDFMENVSQSCPWPSPLPPGAPPAPLAPNTPSPCVLCCSSFLPKDQLLPHP